MEKSVPLIALFFPLLCLAMGKGYDVISALLYLFAIMAFFSRRKIIVTSSIKSICWVFAAYFLCFVFSLLIKGAKLSYLDWSSRLLYAIPVIFLLLKYPLSLKKLQWGIVGGAIIAGIVAIVQISFFDVGRAYTNLHNAWGKGYMPIQSGDMAMTLGLLSLSLGLFHLKKKKYAFAALALIATLLGIGGSFLSGSRGGWLAIPVVFAYLLIEHRKHLNLKNVSATLIVLALLFTGMNKFDPGGIMDRIDQGIHNTQVYSKGDKNTSVGIRFVLWKSAMETFEQNPIFGAGYEGRVLSREQQVKAGTFPKVIADEGYLHAHAHNQYLEALSVRGIIGLLILLAIFFVPIQSFVKQSRHNENSQILKEMGIVTVLSVMAYGLTQAFFNANSGVVFYSLMIVILCTTQAFERRQ
jgi:O-antigen ligase